jgi:hypothetical protein
VGCVEHSWSETCMASILKMEGFGGLVDSLGLSAALSTAGESETKTEVVEAYVSEHFGKIKVPLHCCLLMSSEVSQAYLGRTLELYFHWGAPPPRPPETVAFRPP